jgi:hypothetical protein
MVTLSAWEYGSHLYIPQKLDIYLYPTRFDYQAANMDGVGQ